MQHVTVDVVVLTVRAGELCALVVRRGEAPYKGGGGFRAASWPTARTSSTRPAASWSRRPRSVPGSVRLEQLATYGAPGRDPRRRTVSVAWLAVLPRPAVPEGGTDRSRASWRPTEWLLGRGRLAFDHRTILRDGVERARAKLEYTNIATAFLEPEFTIAQLREVYEVVWGHALDAGNFHRKVTKTDGFVAPTGRRLSAGRGRPAELFTVGTEESLYPPLTRRSLT